MANETRYGLLAGWIVILLAAGLYLATLDTGLRPDELSGGDLITHQYAQVQARPGNAPGYPLYTMGGWLWFRLTRPLPGWALSPLQRLSSFSTVWALLSLFVLYRVALRVAHANWPISALSTAFYAVTYFFWYYSVTTEQYTSAVFQTLLVVWLAFRWDDEQGAGRPGDVYLLGLAFVVGTCLANLVTTLFLVPPLIWFVLSRRPDWSGRPGLWARAAGLALLPLSSYVYVYARGASHPEWRGAGQWASTWAWFADFITTRQGRDELAPGLTLGHFFTDEYPALVWGELTWIVLIGGLLGLWWMGRRRAFFLYGTLAIYFLFCWVDRFGNWYQVIIPAYPLIILGFAAGLAHLWARTRNPGARATVAHGFIVLGLVGLVAYRFAASLPRADQSHRPDDSGLDPGWAILADQPLDHSVIVSEHSEWLALEYLSTIWGAEPPVSPRPLCPHDLPALMEGHPTSPSPPAVYITRLAASIDPTCLAGWHRYAAGASLIRVQAVSAMQIPASARPVLFEFAPELTLAGLEVHSPPPGRAESQTVWHVSLYWQARGAMDTDYTVSVRPLRDGQLIAGSDGQAVIQDHIPVWGSYPTTRWTPGEIVRDDYVIPLPDQIVPDGAQVIVYRQTDTGFDNLGQADLTLTP